MFSTWCTDFCELKDFTDDTGARQRGNILGLGIATEATLQYDHNIWAYNFIAILYILSFYDFFCDAREE